MACFVIKHVNAALPIGVTPAQLIQFRSLSASQQQAFAKKSGIDLSKVKGQTAAKTLTTKEQAPAISKRDVKTAEPKNKALTAFGYDLFSGQPLTLAPLDDLPVPSHYILATGDQINIALYGKESSNYTLTVNREGNVILNNLGPISVAGLSFAELRAKIKAYIKQKMIGVDVSVSMGQLRTMQILVLGEAYKPGAYVLNSLATVTQALKSAGGIKRSGTLRNIQIKRHNKVVGRIDLYDWLIKGDTSDDFRLHNGDVIFIPVKGTEVTITGQVQRPAVYELKHNSSLFTALAIAGGVKKKSAVMQNILIQRATEKGSKMINTRLEADKNKHFILKSGDKVTIQQKPEHYRNEVMLLGNVTHPGVFQWQPGMKIADLIKDQERDLLPFTDFKYGLVFRSEPRVTLLKFNLAEALHNKNSVANLSLEKHDKVILFDKESQAMRYGLPALIIGKLNQYLTTAQLNKYSTLEEKSRTKASANGLTQELKQQSAAKQDKGFLRDLLDKAIAAQQFPHAIIQGDVKFPGNHPLPEQATLLDMLEMAGGLKESAYTLEAEVTRYTQLADQSTKIKHHTINLEKLLQGDQAENIRLHNRDTVHIFRSPAWLERYTITLEGEVKFPGNYTVQRGATLGEVIARAGGVTKYAYPKGAVFSRERLRTKEALQITKIKERLLAEVGNMTFRKQSSTNPLSATDPEKSMALIEKLNTAKPLGRMVIHLDKIIDDDDDDDQDVMIENGDRLFIPAYSKVVTVMGHVQVPSSFIFDSAMNVEEYIAQAGGVLQQSDEDRIYVIRANGSVMLPNHSAWFSRSDKPLEPGDTIIVPIDTNYADPLDTLTSGTQILYQLGVAYSAIKR